MEQAKTGYEVLYSLKSLKLFRIVYHDDNQG